MHETHLLKHIFRYLEGQEELSQKKIKKITFTLSEFGGISKEHFLSHYHQESQGTAWESTEIEIKRTPCGPELEITRLEFAPKP